MELPAQKRKLSSLNTNQKKHWEKSYKNADLVKPPRKSFFSTFKRLSWLLKWIVLKPYSEKIPVRGYDLTNFQALDCTPKGRSSDGNPEFSSITAGDVVVEMQGPAETVEFLSELMQGLTPPPRPPPKSPCADCRDAKTVTARSTTSFGA